MIGHLAKQYGVPLVYCNVVGGNDQLIFDGNSCAFNAQGEALKILPGFTESVAVVDPRWSAGATPAAARGTR